MMRSWWWVAMSLALTSLAEADVYRWVDPQGNVIFSDTPRDGAEKIELGPTTVVPAARPTVKMTPELPSDTPREGELGEALPYTSVVIVEPAAESTLRNTQVVVVGVATEPPLQTQLGHRMQLFVDGAPYGEPVPTDGFIVDNLTRGAHTLEAVVVDDSGAELARAATSTFFVQQQSVLQGPGRAAP